MNLCCHSDLCREIFFVTFGYDRAQMSQKIFGFLYKDQYDTFACLFQV